MYGHFSYLHFSTSVMGMQEFFVNLLAEEKEDHKWHSKNGADGGDGDELRGFDIVAAIFGGKKTKRGGGRESLNQCANGNNFDGKFEPGEYGKS